MDLKSKLVPQDLEYQSDLKTKRDKIRMSLAKASKYNKRVKNGKKGEYSGNAESWRN